MDYHILVVVAVVEWDVREVSNHPLVELRVKLMVSASLPASKGETFNVNT